MVCRQRVGWRQNARKIILMATDRDFHFAMDGKLTGILERNDGLCHLNGTHGEPGYYTHSETLDYPSVSQISSVVQQNSFLILFAVIPRYKSIWEAMSKLVPGSSVEILEEDSENIVELITKSYGEITSTIKVKVDNVPEDVIVTITSRCTGSQETTTNACHNVEQGATITFSADILPIKCLDPDKRH